MNINKSTTRLLAHDALPAGTPIPYHGMDTWTRIQDAKPMTGEKIAAVYGPGFGLQNQELCDTTTFQNKYNSVEMTLKSLSNENTINEWKGTKIPKWQIHHTKKRKLYLSIDESVIAILFGEFKISAKEGDMRFFSDDRLTKGGREKLYNKCVEIGLVYSKKLISETFNCRGDQIWFPIDKQFIHNEELTWQKMDVVEHQIECARHVFELLKTSLEERYFPSNNPRGIKFPKLPSYCMRFDTEYREWQVKLVGEQEETIIEALLATYTAAISQSLNPKQDVPVPTFENAGNWTIVKQKELRLRAKNFLQEREAEIVEMEISNIHTNNNNIASKEEIVDTIDKLGSIMAAALRKLKSKTGNEGVSDNQWASLCQDICNGAVSKHITHG